MPLLVKYDGNSRVHGIGKQERRATEGKSLSIGAYVFLNHEGAGNTGFLAVLLALFVGVPAEVTLF